MSAVKDDFAPVQITAGNRPVTIDGNEACAGVAYRLSEVCSIFPITPATPMAELADQWSGERRTNIWGTVPDVIEMQSELGVAGTLHGLLQTGSLGTSFTSSQGLLLMVPNMFKIAGELAPCVIHVACRALSLHALSIYPDHQDIMSVRQTGFAMLGSSSVQEAQDLAAVAHAAGLQSRVPFLHFFDGFRTSHEENKIQWISDDELRRLVDEDLVFEHRRRAMNPDHPDVRGVIQNTDVYFQGREAATIYHANCPRIVQETMDRFASITGRSYRLFDYFGHPAPERVLVLMGSGAETARETVEYLAKSGERVGVVQVHLFRPFDERAFLGAVPKSVKSVAVLDRCKEPGATGEPLYQDVLAAFVAQARTRPLPLIIGGRFGIGGKEFHPEMVKAVLDELTRSEPNNHFTIGIHDDVMQTSLPFDDEFGTETDEVHRAIFYGLGADGTVGANKNTIKIIGEDTDLYAQAYFVYDSKKSGSETISHLRFGPAPIHSAYLIRSAQFIGCHHFGFVDRIDVLTNAAAGATLLLNSPYGPDEVWNRLPRPMQEKIIAKRIRVFVIDATRVAHETGLGLRTNTILQTCFFAISGVVPADQAIEHIKRSIQVTYGRKGEEVVKHNFEAVDAALACLHAVPIPEAATSRRMPLHVVCDSAPRFVRDCTVPMIEGNAEHLPVSAMPADGVYPSGTSKWEKRDVAEAVPLWDPELCIQCGHCSFVCPHGCIRARLFDSQSLALAPDGFKSAPIDAAGFPDTRYTVQVYMEDCTGCGLCSYSCPAKRPEDPAHLALGMVPKNGLLEADRASLRFLETLPVNDRANVDFGTVRGVQFLEPLFEFPGACAGCGETPYLRLASQLFGDRMLIANASGCSSVFGGSLPTTPWTASHEGCGPAWATSLFEDNAEFGLGMRISADRHMRLAQALLRDLTSEIGFDLVDELINGPQRLESQIRSQRERVHRVRQRLSDIVNESAGRSAALARRLLSVADHLVRRSVWIVGGDGWAYDIGSAGLDHVLASGKDVNILVLDNEVYANTGGQSSKATPLGAVAKFASLGKKSAKKDLALPAIALGDVYVARVALGANPQQTLTAFREAEAYPGPSLIIAYSHCIAHGIEMQHGLEQQSLAVHSGCWPLIRYDPELRGSDQNPFQLDSTRPTRSYEEFAEHELRFRMLRNTNPLEAEQLAKAASEGIRHHWALYERLADARIRD